MLWITGMALVASVLAIAALLAVVAYDGLATFWPRDLDRVQLVDGSFFLGVPTRSEAYEPDAARRDELQQQADQGDLPAGVFDPQGRVIRRLYRVGNKEVTGQPFRWVDLADIASVEKPTDAALLERTQWGIWLGIPEQILLQEEKTLTPGADGAVPTKGIVETQWGPRPFTRTILEKNDTGVRVVERVIVADSVEQTWSLLPAALEAAATRRSVIHSLNKNDVGEINTKLERARLNYRTVQILHDRGKASDERVAGAKVKFDSKRQTLEAQYNELLQKIRQLQAVDDHYRIVVRDPETGAMAPRAQTEPDEPMRLSQIVRVVRANDLDFVGRLGVYASRWWEFVSAEPREANTEGGVFPVIFGTIMLTILLSIIVVPLGVVTALYLREYAKQGLIVSFVRIAINNLAGVPSIVYGVFGLGFFCYTLGGFIDNGPANPWPIGMWWLGAGGTLGVLVGAVFVGALARPTPGKTPTLRDRLLGVGAITLWLSALGLFIALIVTTPYFTGFFPARTTFGTKGILWSALTLALLTLPVVVVATEEAISAVPGSLRQGSYGCGASRWQTIRRIVLPSAMGGIMTGMILAIARGAGEVAPLMLVGAVKLAPKLPFEKTFPYFHLERSFMHLGFHIYDLGFQSPDSEAARPVVWTTTFILILVVVSLNLAAIMLRSRIRRRTQGAAF